MWSHYGFLRYGMVRVKGRSLIEVLPIQLSTFIPLDSCQAQRFVHLDALNLKTSRSHSVLSDACSQMLTLTLSLTLSLSFFSGVLLHASTKPTAQAKSGYWPLAKAHSPCSHCTRSELDGQSLKRLLSFGTCTRLPNVDTPASHHAGRGHGSNETSL